MFCKGFEPYTTTIDILVQELYDQTCLSISIRKTKTTKKISILSFNVDNNKKQSKKLHKLVYIYLNLNII